MRPLDFVRVTLSLAKGQDRLCLIAVATLPAAGVRLRPAGNRSSLVLCRSRRE